MMYKATGDSKYHDIFRSVNNNRNFYATYIYAGMSKTDYPVIDLNWQKLLIEKLVNEADNHVRYSEENPYDTINIPKHWQFWGYNTYITTKWGDYLMMAHQLTGDDKYKDSLGASLHFGLGMNPDNLSLITGLVEDKLAYDEPDDTLHADTLRNPRATPDGITLYGFFEAPWFAWNDVNTHSTNTIFNLNTKKLNFPPLEAFSDYHNMIPMTEYTIHQTMEDQILAFGYMLGQSQNPVTDIDSLMRDPNAVDEDDDTNPNVGVVDDNDNSDPVDDNDQDPIVDDNTGDDEVVVIDDPNTEINVTNISLSLVDAENDLIIDDYSNLPSQTVINTTELGISSINFVVESDLDTISKVSFNSDLVSRNEGVAPYAWFGDSAGNFSGIELALGTYNLSVEIYSGNGELLASRNYEITLTDEIVEDVVVEEDVVEEDPVQADLFTISLVDSLSESIISGFEAISDTITVNLANLSGKSLEFKANLNSENADSTSVKSFKYTSTVVKGVDDSSFGSIDGTALSIMVEAYDNLEASGESLSEKLVNVNFINSNPVDDNPVVDDTPVESPVLDTEMIILSLIDSEKNELVAGYENLKTSTRLNLEKLLLNKVNFVANVDDCLKDQLKYVEFIATDLNRTERIAPYAWFGDNGNGDYYTKDLELVTYNLTVNAVSKSDEIIASKVFTINLTDEDELVSLSLVDADTNELVSGYENLDSDTQLNLGTLSLENLNFIANVDDSLKDDLKHVEFIATDLNRTEQIAPYAWFGDNGNGNYYKRKLSPGVYNLTVNVVSNSDIIVNSRVFTITISDDN